FVTLQCRSTFLGFDIPKQNFGIAAARGNQVSVGAELYPTDRCNMALQCRRGVLRRFDVSNAYVTVETGSRQPLPIGRKVEVENRRPGLSKGQDLLTVCHRPDANDAIETSRRQSLAIG